MSYLSLILWSCLFACRALGVTSAEKIPGLSAQTESITVSGISSGAFMAVQLSVAYSNQIKGIAAIAGGIYNCAEGDPEIAAKICMKKPVNLNSETSVSYAKVAYQKAQIDNPQNLARQRVFILNGTEDKTVLPEAGQKLAEFYQAFHASPSTEFSLKMGHGFPSDNGKNPCAVSRFPWVNYCNYDGAKTIFETLYGALNPAGLPANPIVTIDQTEFTTTDAKMLDTGNLYIPSVCRDSKTRCRIHVALHGCLQGPSIAKKAFIEDAGYNEWAETNNIIVLYPGVGISAGNPNGCWDWFGYTGKDYAVKSSPQMTAIMAMVQRLTQKN